MVYWSEAAGPVGVLRRLPEAGRAVSPGCGASRISPDSRETGHVVRFSIARPWRIAKLSKHEAANARSSRCEKGYEKQDEPHSHGREAIRPMAG